MGKVVKFTGSRVLGAGLKRLRGSRTLADISKLSKSPPFSDRIRPVSAPSLCQIESGQTMPTLDTLHSLATLYRVNPQRLYDLIVQDRLTSEFAVPVDEAGTLEAFREAARADSWEAALALAIHGESLAETDAGSVKWRANRATAMRKVGMVQDAIWLMHECADDPNATQDQRFRINANLADAYGKAGLLSPAAACLAQALAQMPDDTPTHVRCRILRGRARLLLRQVEWGLAEGERPVREAQRLLAEARALAPGDDRAEQLKIEIEVAASHRLLGNRLVAARDLARIAADAEELDEFAIASWAHEALGIMRREDGKLPAAQRELEKAEAAASKINDIDSLFHVNFELYLVAEAASASARLRDRLIRRCQRYYPLLTARTPSVQSFERLGGYS